MNAVGIDVSKGKSMIAAVSSAKAVLQAPIEFAHTKKGLEEMIATILSLDGESRIVLEATGHYHEPVVTALIKAELYVSVVNPVLVHDYGNNTIRRVKTDKKDALKIARYGLDNWDELREHLPPGIIRQQLKMYSRQYNLYIKTIRALENNLIALLDKTFPEINKLFTSRKRKDGRQKWVEFATEFWHVDIITSQSEDEFTKAYQKWCTHTKYQFKEAKAKGLYAKCNGHSIDLPLCINTQLIITTAAAQVTNIGVCMAAVKNEMIRLSALLPEYDAVISMYGVGELTAAQLIAEIGDVRRFKKRGALAAYAGIDPVPQQSGKFEKKSTPTSKRGSSPLRKTLFQIVSTHLRRSPQNEPIFQFIDRKRAEGKPYFVYMTAAANKFLRIYYARVKEHLSLKAKRT